MLDGLGNNHAVRPFMGLPNIYYAGYFIKGVHRFTKEY
jgi:hypothetical protein